MGISLQGQLQTLINERGAFAGLSAGMLCLNEAGEIQAANERTRKYLGYSLEELRQMTVFKINPHLNLLEWKKLWRELKSQCTLQFEGEHITARGMLVPVKINACLVEDGDQTICLEIIEHPLETRGLIKLMNIMAEVGKVGGWELNLIKDEIIFTGEARRLLQLEGHVVRLSSEEVEALLPDFVDDADLEILSAKLKQAILEGTPFEQELLYRPRAGAAEKRLLINAVPEQTELQTIKVFGTVQDLAAFEARHEDLYLTKFTLDHAGEMVFWVEPCGKIIYCNKAFCELTGYSPQEARELDARRLYPEADPEKRREAIWERLRREQTLELESGLRTKSGEIIPIYSNIKYIKYGEQELLCVLTRDLRNKQARDRELKEALQKLEELSSRLKDENLLLQDEITVQHNFNNIISRSKKYQKVLRQVAQVADSPTTVLILGETGTGKELLARAIHSLSPLAERPLVKLNCATLPPNLIESELFGHEKGAFTGAHKQKKGRFELADGGTLFLDEVGELPLEVQPKLLRLLQEGEFERVGGNQTLRAKVRLIAATNRDLQKMIAEGRFREDLFYRLNVFPVTNLPLRERKEDIEVLIHHFAQKYGERIGKKIEKVNQADIRLLEGYDFPGNVRELENIVERAVILTSGDTLNLRASLSFQQRSDTCPGMNGAFISFEEMQKQYIIKALQSTNGRVSGPRGAARLLELNPRTLASKMRRLGIDRENCME